jgi:hypothetical protein
VDWKAICNLTPQSYEYFFQNYEYRQYTNRPKNRHSRAPIVSRMFLHGRHRFKLRVQAIICHVGFVTSIGQANTNIRLRCKNSYLYSCQTSISSRDFIVSCLPTINSKNMDNIRIPPVSNNGFMFLWTTAFSTVTNRPTTKYIYS